jgi:anthranilate phosphoribosyltransferase
MSSETKVCELKDGWYKTYEICPEDFGFKRCDKSELAGGTPAENAQITRDILSGKITGPKRETVLLNAGAAIYVGGKADSMAEGAKKAAELIDNGKALERLDALVKASNQAE